VGERNLFSTGCPGANIPFYRVNDAKINRSPSFGGCSSPETASKTIP
jgi:hypothetical protein